VHERTRLEITAVSDRASEARIAANAAKLPAACVSTTTLGVQFCELSFGIDLHQCKVAKNGMSALRSKRADRALKSARCTISSQAQAASLTPEIPAA
jgi:hypothetical protein